MAEQDSKIIFWDRHEAALLIDLCAKVRDRVVRRTEGIQQLSAKLKRRAELMGRKVDAEFRSVQSLAKYYAMAEYLVTDGLRGEPEAAPIFTSLFRTYVSEPDEFKKILDEAERQCQQKVFEFDTHEVIKLIEASSKLSKQYTIADAAENLSQVFQDYARRRGIDDEDSARDTTSVAKKLIVTDGLRRGRQTESAAPREVFLVKLFKYDPDKFGALLSEANKVLGIETEVPPPEVLSGILKKYFPSGFKYTSAIAKKQFHRYLNEDKIIEITDEQLIKALQDITVEYGEKLFLPYTPEQQKLMDEVRSTVEGLLNEGYSCVYADKVFERYADRLAEVLPITSVVDLMEREGWEKNIITRDTPDIAADVRKFFNEAKRKISYFELEQEMWFIPFEKLKTAVIASPQIICVKPETYIDISALPIDGDMLPSLEQFLQKTLQPVQTMAIEDCRRLIYDEFPAIEFTTQEYTPQGFGNMLRGLFGHEFSFNRNMISSACEIVSKRQLFVDFCNERKSFTLDELQTFAEEINSQIEFKSVRRVAVRVSVNDFIHRDQIHFNVPAIDAMLDTMIDDCRSIKSLSMHFDELPPIEGFEWNEYILESYLFCFSEKFELINSVFSKLSWGGAAGRKSLHLAFEDVAEKILSKSKHWKDRETALDLLVNEKILLRRAFKDIDEVIRRLKSEEE